MKKSSRWDNYFLTMADVTAGQSKDRSTRIGAVCVDPFDRVISTGFNGLPRGVKDASCILDNREVKYELVIHAEMNAILFAKQDLAGCKMYCTHLPCSRCASVIIQSGITEVVAGIDPDAEFTLRWEESHKLTRKIFKEAGVKLREIAR